MQQLVLFIHVFAAVGLVALILIQHGKGADMGAAFGSGASATVFGARGSVSFLVKVTGTLAAIFFATSLMLSYITTHDVKNASQTSLPVPTTQTQEQKQNNKIEDQINQLPGTNQKN